VENMVRLVTFNLHDFDLLPQSRKKKDPRAVEQIAKAILTMAPDVAVLQEVRGFESLLLFNQNYLDSRYYPFLKPGNDPNRSIGFLVRRNFYRGGNRVSVKIESHSSHYATDDNGRLLKVTRDIPALILREHGASSPFLILLGVHYRALKGLSSDFRRMSILAQRSHEVFETRRIARAYRERFGQRPFIVIGGDFNSDLRYESELDDLYKDFFNPWDLSAIPFEDRFTYYFPPTRERREFDGFLLDPRLALNFRGGRIIRFPSPEFFNSEETPFVEHHYLTPPSDHSPVVIDLEIP
jgi:hypothetical protein